MLSSIWLHLEIFALQNAVVNSCSILCKYMYDMYVTISKSWTPKCTLAYIYGRPSLKFTIMVVPWLQIHSAIATYYSSALQRCTTTRNFYSTLLLQLQWTGIKVAKKQTIEASHKSIRNTVEEGNIPRECWQCKELSVSTALSYIAISPSLSSS